MNEDRSPGQCGNTCDKVKQHHKWTAEEKKAMLALAKWCYAECPQLHRAFVSTTHDLAIKGEEAGFDWAKLAEFECGLAATCIAGNFHKAAVDMADYLIASVEKYLGGSSDPSYQALVTQLSDFRKSKSASESPSIP